LILQQLFPDRVCDTEVRKLLERAPIEQIRAYLYAGPDQSGQAAHGNGIVYTARHDLPHDAGILW
jgi:hypothetical protein